MKPGGWVEIQEFTGYIRSDDDSMRVSDLAHFWDKTAEALEPLGFRYRVANSELRSLLEEAGFVDIISKTFKVPIGTWPKVSLYYFLDPLPLFGRTRPLLGIVGEYDSRDIADHSSQNKILRLCGLYMKESVAKFIDALASKPLLSLGMEPEEVEALASRALQEIDTSGAHPYLEFRFWMGRKPQQA